MKDSENYVNILLLKAEELYAGYDANERLRELQELTSKLKTKYLKDQRMLLTDKIKQAEQRDDEEEVANLLEEFNKIIKKGM